MPEYRRDGWPLCPQCGCDELMSSRAFPANYRTMHELLDQWKPAPTDAMLCLYCRWEGTVPPAPLTPRH